MLSKEVIKAALMPAEYLMSLNHPLHPEGVNMRGPCPFCGGSEDATKFVTTDELWHCKSCNMGGDVIMLHMKLNDLGFADAIADLSIKFNIREDITYSQLHQLVKDRETKRIDYLNTQESTKDRAKKIWSELPPVSAISHISYIKGRNISYIDDIRQGNHSVCLPLRDLDGEIINVVGRRIDGGEPKVAGLKGGSSMGTFGDYSQMTSKRRILVVEGVFDYLTAREIFRSNLDIGVIGVHGASNMHKIVAGLASTKNGQQFMFYPQNDMAAAEAHKKCIKVSTNWSVVHITHPIPERFNDLNEWWCSGDLTL